MHSVRHKFPYSTPVSPAIAMLALVLLAPANVAAQLPAPGQLLVATEEVRGSLFRETVVLLLYYADDGAQGLVINRPMEAAPRAILPDLDGIERYEGMLYWGGPVQLASLRMLMRSNDPPSGAVHIFDDVYLAAPGEKLPDGVHDASSLRFFLGYSGWGPGQLDAELLQESWHLLPATAELTFTDDTDGIWRRLMPPSTIRASIPNDRAGNGARAALAADRAARGMQRSR